jgi:hypothetical protein
MVEKILNKKRREYIFNRPIHELIADSSDYKIGNYPNEPGSQFPDTGPYRKEVVFQEGFTQKYFEEIDASWPQQYLDNVVHGISINTKDIGIYLYDKQMITSSMVYDSEEEDFVDLDLMKVEERAAHEDNYHQTLKVVRDLLCVMYDISIKYCNRLNLFSFIIARGTLGSREAEGVFRASSILKSFDKDGKNIPAPQHGDYTKDVTKWLLFENDHMRMQARLGPAIDAIELKQKVSQLIIALKELDIELSTLNSNDYDEDFFLSLKKKKIEEMRDRNSDFLQKIRTVSISDFLGKNSNVVSDQSRARQIIADLQRGNPEVDSAMLARALLIEKDKSEADEAVIKRVMMGLMRVPTDTFKFGFMTNSLTGDYIIIPNTSNGLQKIWNHTLTSMQVRGALVHYNGILVLVPNRETEYIYALDMHVAETYLSEYKMSYNGSHMKVQLIVREDGIIAPPGRVSWGKWYEEEWIRYVN